MKDLLCALVRSSFKEESPLFINYLSKYLKISHTETVDITEYLIKYKKAFEIYKTCSSCKNINKIIYVFLSLCNSKAENYNIRKLALAYSIFIMPNLRTHKLSLINLISKFAEKYKFLRKINTENEILKFLLKNNENLLKEYENTVLNSSNDFLIFYSEMYKIYKKLENLYNLYFYIQDFKFLKLENSIEILEKFYNKASLKFINTGESTNNFYIQDLSIDYGLKPNFIKNEIAESVLYIGKYTKLLNLQNNFKSFHPFSYKNYLQIFYNKTKFYIQEYLNLINFIESIFLFKRSDFIEYLFFSLKENRKINNRNFIFIIDNCISILNNKFSKNISLYIDNEFSLYLNHKFISSDLSVKLLIIFKILYKLKRIEIISRKLKKDLKIVYNLNSFVFYKIINKFKFTGQNIDNLKKEFENFIDKILKFLEDKIFYNLLINLEEMLIKLGKLNIVDDRKFKESLNLFSKKYNF